MKALSPISLIEGSGRNAVTQYHCVKIDKAWEEKRDILVMRGGEVIQTSPPPKKHRDLTAVFGETHPNAGEGKFIDIAAFNKTRTRVVGAQHVNPYLLYEGGKPRCYRAILEAFKKMIGLHALSKLSATLSFSDKFLYELLWEGRRNKEECVAHSGWITREDLLKQVFKIEPTLLHVLNGNTHEKTISKSGLIKFDTDLNVLRRATCSINIFNGEVNLGGGISPYAFPLMHAGFAIDKRFLTYDVDRNGLELAQNYFGFAIGRKEPHFLKKAQWNYEGLDSDIAYLNESVRQKALKRAKQKVA